MIEIVAEIGRNHEGDMTLAKRLIELAKENGASYAKFQLYDSLKLRDEPFLCELSKGQAFSLFEYGRQVGIEVFFSVFDIERVAWCEEMGVSRYKIAFSQHSNMELVKEVIETNKLMLVSTNHKQASGNKIKLLYCIPEYPTDLQRLNFNRLDFFEGFSDHTIGIDAAKIAMARGAKIIEKHFTIDKEMAGPDHIHSMLPCDLHELRRFANIVEEVL